MIVIIPDMPPVPPGASHEVRRQMYDAYCAELRRLNPRHFNTDGSIRPWWRVLFGLWSK